MKSLSEEQFLKELRKEIRLYRKRIREHEQSIEYLNSLIDMREKIIERCVNKLN